MFLAAAALFGCEVSYGEVDTFDTGEVDEGEAPLLPDLPAPSCDPRRDDMCEPGFKCSYVDDPVIGPTNRCVPLAGEGEADELCTRVGESDTCGEHGLCWALEPGGDTGICVDFCSSMLSCLDPDKVCTISNGGLLPLCLERCHPLLQDCLPSWGCYPDSNERWACDRDRSGPSGGHGDPCDCLNCCDPGLMCVPGPQVDDEDCAKGGALGCCAQICDLGDEGTDAEEEGPCPTPLEQCRAVYASDETIPGYEEVGVCRL
ncbi:hypothetical protein G6O69_23805 [Pseudenhygromyxa sp. WMMC2535]|uniref:hypothetical protein n=1 Tax=Pseudenhygromyxa sp. WMMC2535 TaxID=2712867 RepID=UPI0015536BB9|nr:hypothetical protein [Pseudenhygromyxa sp. WMMC2535]NVB40885.1 hypothetical protein [Pseudenhygromyxa sp. WMMC2535]